MVRRTSYIVLFAFLCLAFTGCSGNWHASKPSQSVSNAKNMLIKAVPSETIDTKGMTKLDEFSYDLDLDNTEEKIELYTEAGRDEKGEMAWNDGQKWLLIVCKDGKVYPLLSQYVQLGSVYFTVSNNAVGDISNINIIVHTSAGFSIKIYTYNKEKDGFEGGILYDSKDNNIVHSSIPGY